VAPSVRRGRRGGYRRAVVPQVANSGLIPAETNRGRRSRRRRNRGRGFPDSKYAARGPTRTAEPAPIGAVQEEPEESGDEDTTPIILPGNH